MKQRADRNRTLTCSVEELKELSKKLVKVRGDLQVEDIEGRILNSDLFKIAAKLPREFVDLLVIDPPYNISKNYNGNLFRERDKISYSIWFREMFDSIRHVLKDTASVYVCSDWKTSIIIAPILDEFLFIQNRITWEREKGRGAKQNWKNNTEDIWFCTVSKKYYFNVDNVKLKRRVIAPYRTKEGKPKDWMETKHGNFRLTYPSNIWTDISVPFWSMPENTDHPTQKPEKLIAKLILSSCKEGDFVFDPFLGSGTTAVVAKKLNRKFSGVELNEEYCCWAQKRLEIAEKDSSIQGYADGVFWERNSLNAQQKTIVKQKTQLKQKRLF